MMRDKVQRSSHKNPLCLEMGRKAVGEDQQDTWDLQIYRAYKALFAALDRAVAADCGGYRHFSVLSAIDQASGVTAREIADRLDYDTGALSRIIEQLTTRGLIARNRSELDRRNVRLTTTLAGRRKLADCEPKADEVRTLWRQQLSPTEQEGFEAAMSKLAELGNFAPSETTSRSSRTPGSPRRPALSLQ